MDKKTRKSIYKRAMKVAIISLIGFTVLIIRLFWIQIVKGKEYGLDADKQQLKEIRIAPARGNIFDRNNNKLTNNKIEKTVFLLRDVVINDNQIIESMREKLNFTEKDIETIKRSKNRIVEIPLNIDIEETIVIRGVIIEDKIIRYDDNNLLSHVIGYIKRSENVGEYGIEKEYDSLLKMNSDSGVKYIAVDGKQRVIPGLMDTEVISEKEIITNSIKLTIDIMMQKEVEKILDNNKANGAVIITDVSTGDILVMASRPNINQNDIEANLNSNKMDFYNKAIEVSYPPGSIFKTVVLLAALEENTINLDETFFCLGYEDLGNFKIRCNKTEGHGELTTYEAFSVSCNSAFIQIGKKIGAKKIIDMARRLGFERKVQDILIEASGNLPQNDELLGPAIGNISIGQSNIEVTPLQVTNMMMIIANEGIQKDISIADSIVTEDGRFVKKVVREKDERVLSTRLCRQITNCLEGVIDSGTAKNVNLSRIGDAAGKTGSAENSMKNTHAWFSGFYPRDNPKYVITVFIEEGGSGGKIAVPIFEEIAKNIYDIN
ncbi:MAG: penicillin-binding transpeptidase domain-containing protein [Tissierellales bacterium]